MNLVSLEKLNELCFPLDPRPITMLQRWCRKQQLPARRIAGLWYVDIDRLENPEPDQPLSPQAQAVLDKYRQRRQH